MCGISGIISKNKNIEDYIDYLIELQKKRGSEYNGKINFNNLWLGHNEISILDIKDRSNQPYVFKNYAITFNGKIYNFLDLKKMLKSKFLVNFDTDNDNEVLIKMFYYIGINETLEKIEGMFSIGLLDKNTNKLYLIRDRLGEKPLYYYSDDNQFIFASLPSPIAKTLFKFEDKKFNVDFFCLNYYLFSGAFPKSNSMFNGIFAVKPGYFLEVDLNNLNFCQEKWWNPEFNKKDEYKILIKDIMEKYQLTKYEGKILFSGGIDSGTIAFFNKSLDYIILDNGEVQEAKSFLEDLNHSDKLNIINNDFISNNKNKMNNELENIIDYSGLFCRSSLPVILTSLYLRDNTNTKVLISGNAGDDLFYVSPRLYKNTDFLENQIDDIFAFKNYMDTNNNNNYFNNFFSIFFHNITDIILNEIDIPENLKKENIPRWLELNTYVLGDLNIDSNNTFMYYSIECRSPFLNHRLVERALSDDPDIFFYKSLTKYGINNMNEYKEYTDNTKKPLKEILLTKINKNNIFREKKGYGLEEENIIFAEISKENFNSFKKRGILNFINENSCKEALYPLISNLEIFIQKFEYLLDIDLNEKQSHPTIDSFVNKIKE